MPVNLPLLGFLDKVIAIGANLSIVSIILNYGIYVIVRDIKIIENIAADGISGIFLLIILGVYYLDSISDETISLVAAMYFLWTIRPISIPLGLLIHSSILLYVCFITYRRGQSLRFYPVLSSSLLVSLSYIVYFYIPHSLPFFVLQGILMLFLSIFGGIGFKDYLSNKSNHDVLLAFFQPFILIGVIFTRDVGVDYVINFFEHFFSTFKFVIPNEILMLSGGAALVLVFCYLSETMKWFVLDFDEEQRRSSEQKLSSLFILIPILTTIGIIQFVQEMMIGAFPWMYP